MEKQEQLQKLRDNLLETKRLLEELNSDKKTIVSIHYNLFVDTELEVLVWDVNQLKKIVGDNISYDNKDLCAADVDGVKFIAAV